MNVKIILKAVAAAAVSASAVVCLTFGACAGEIESITVLGDSISSGYGLNDGERSYGSYLGEYFGARLRILPPTEKQPPSFLNCLRATALYRNRSENPT